MRFRDYINFWKFSKSRLKSLEDYQEFQQFQAQLLENYFNSNDLYLQSTLTLDLGSGFGGYSWAFQDMGASVIALDNLALRFPHPDLENVHPIQADAKFIPLASNSVDFVFCASLIEHVPIPEDLLNEMFRVIKPGGHSYVSFPPFYSLRGGHDCSPFHYFGEGIALKLRNHQKSSPEWLREVYDYTENPTSYSDLYLDHGLYVLTIRKFRSLIRDSSFQVIDMGTRYLPYSFTRWPIIGEFLTWHAQFLLKKPA